MNGAKEFVSKSIKELIGSIIFLSTAMAVRWALVGVAFATSPPSVKVALTLVSVGIGVAVGFALTGGQMNAAITAFMCTIKENRMSWLLPFIAMQTLGFYLVTKVTLMYLGPQYLIVPARTPGEPPISVLLYEGIGVPVFAVGVFLAVMLQNSFSSILVSKLLPPLIVGHFLLVPTLMAFPVSGGAINPSLALGTQIAAGKTGGVSGDWWLYWPTALAAAIVCGLAIKSMEKAE